MSYKLLTRLAVSGIQKNKRTVVPYLIAGTLTVMIYYILNSLAYSSYIYANHKEAFYGAQTIAILLEIASQIVGIFAVFFLFYANQFVIKGRKKEMALYGVLGMSKGNITYILMIETVLHAVCCIILGITAGTFLNKLALLTLYKIIGQTPVNGMVLSVKALQNALILFGIIYAACLFYNISAIRVGNPIELLHSDTTGEKEPKIKIVALVVGLITIGFGYYMAITTDSTADAIGMLFLCILLVIIGTYCLFIAGSIFLLKVLKNNKKFYFQTKNFISVSNLMFRMKHNAAGLASICVLSTGVILLLTCGSSLMMLGEKNLDERYPTDIKIETLTTDKNAEREYTDRVQQAADKAGIQTKELVCRRYQTTVGKKSENEIEFMDASGFTDMGACVDMYFVTIEDYNHYTGQNLSLKKSEILLYQSDEKAGKVDRLKMFGKTYQVTGQANYNALYYMIDPSMSLFEKEIIVMSDVDELNGLLEKDPYEEAKKGSNIYIGLNMKGTISGKQKKKFQQSLKGMGSELEVGFKDTDRMFFYNLYGGAFFVGIFLAILFLMATVLIMYYKQMSEGFEDQKRFHILANVGLTEQEAKASIKRQVMILFFLPVVTAILHTLVASHIIRLFLRMVLIVDPATFAAAIAVVCIIFFVVYAVVYKITSGQYYKIVYGE